MAWSKHVNRTAVVRRRHVPTGTAGDRRQSLSRVRRIAALRAERATAAWRSRPIVPLHTGRGNERLLPLLPYRSGDAGHRSLDRPRGHDPRLRQDRRRGEQAPAREAAATTGVVGCAGMSRSLGHGWQVRFRPRANLQASAASAGRYAVTDLDDLGDRPLGTVPKHMHAFVVRQNRFGQPRDAWKREVIDTPALRDDEVLIYVMASGINFNNVWAALGTPLDVIAERQRLGEPEAFHAGGSDCSGIVWAVGRDVRSVSVGDEVIVHSGWWRSDDPWVCSGRDPCSPSPRVYGVTRPITAAIASLHGPRPTSVCQSRLG